MLPYSPVSTYVLFISIISNIVIDKRRYKMSFRFELTTAILFGAGSISKVGEEAAKLGHKALVVTYPDIRRIGLLDKVLQDLKEKKVDAIVFEKVEPNPRV